jgi:hypothetical protein
MSETAEEYKNFVPVTSRAQWEAIEKRLRGIFGEVKFRVDGHEVAVQRKFVAEGRSSLWVYINGKIEYKHMMPDKETKLFDPIVERVWRPRVTHLVSPQKKKALELKWKAKRYSERDIQAMKMIEGFDKHFLGYVPDYSTARTLVRRFKKIEGIEVEL